MIPISTQKVNVLKLPKTGNKYISLKYSDEQFVKSSIGGHLRKPWADVGSINRANKGEYVGKQIINKLNLLEV